MVLGQEKTKFGHKASHRKGRKEFAREAKSPRRGLGVEGLNEKPAVEDSNEDRGEPGERL